MARRKNNSNENQFLRSLDGVAYGLFCSEVMGYFLVWLGEWMNYSALVSWGGVVSSLAGSAVGIGVAYATGARGIALISAALAGAICHGSGVTWVLCAYFSVMLSVYVGEFIRNKTPIDIFITPVFTIASACMMSQFVSPYLNELVWFVVSQISAVTHFQSYFMAALLPVLMSILCITPLSMVSICGMIGLSSIGAGVALVGTCGTMMGLALMSMDDNDIGDVIAIGIGTPILQFKNVIKNPLILIPLMVSALVSGLVDIFLFKITTTPYYAGLGNLMFEGPLSVINSMGSVAWLPMLIVTIFLPMLVSYSMYRALRKLGWIKSGDLKINHL